mgnify:CR=1 FL=1
MPLPISMEPRAWTSNAASRAGRPREPVRARSRRSSPGSAARWSAAAAPASGVRAFEARACAAAQPFLAAQACAVARASAAFRRPAAHRSRTSPAAAARPIRRGALAWPGHGSAPPAAAQPGSCARSAGPAARRVQARIGARSIDRGRSGRALWRRPHARCGADRGIAGRAGAPRHLGLVSTRLFRLVGPRSASPGGSGRAPQRLLLNGFFSFKAYIT